MDTLSTDSLLPMLNAWMTAHPYWAGAVIVVSTLLEGIFVLGFFIPGTVVMFSIGALVAVGVVNLWLALFTAALGAFLGDTISYFIGHYFRDDLRYFALFRKYPHWLPQAELYCHRYGGNSVILGRFIGPLRPFIPAMSGMLGMSIKRFVAIDAIASLLWSPCYMLPGIILGASLSLIAGIASRLAILLALILGSAWLTVWLIRQIYKFLQPRLGANLDKALYWSYRHPVLGRFITGLLQHNKPELGALFQSVLLLMLGFWGFFTLLLVQVYSKNLLDIKLFDFFQSLHSVWGDKIMVAFMDISNSTSNGVIAVVCALWLGFRRHWLSLGHFITLLLLAFLAAFLFNLNIRIETPLPLIDAYIGFPDVHITVTTVLYGFLAVLIAEDLPLRWQRLPYTLAGLWLLGVTVSYLYLSLQLLLPIIAGIFLGLMLVALFGIAYRRHSVPEVGCYGLMTILLLTQLLTAVGLLQKNYVQDVQRHSQPRPVQAIDLSQWQEQIWQTLPLQKTLSQKKYSFLHDHFNFQWAASLAEIQQKLSQQGWQPAMSLGWKTPVDWCSPKTKLSQLPVLPKILYGENEKLRLIYFDPKHSGQRWVLRLWPSHSHTAKNQTPIWLGEISQEQLGNHFGLLTLSEKIEQPTSVVLQYLQRFINEYTVVVKTEKDRQMWLIY